MLARDIYFGIYCFQYVAGYIKIEGFPLKERRHQADRRLSQGWRESEVSASVYTDAAIAVCDELGKLTAPLSLQLAGGSISPRRLALLTAIGELGSISAAARYVGMTYKAAWDAVDIMNNLAGVVLIAAKHGGKGGGGASLTEAGQQLVGDINRVRELQNRMLAMVAAEGADESLWHSLRTIKRMNMRSSARNILNGVIASIDVGAVNTAITIKLIGDDRLVATCTQESVQAMSLTPGDRVNALIKASWVVLADGVDAGSTTAGNCLTGKVSRVTEGAVNGEVTLQLKGGNTLAAIVTMESIRQLDIKPGRILSALVNASSIIINSGDAE